jgi:hypothetical protein
VVHVGHVVSLAHEVLAVATQASEGSDVERQSWWLREEKVEDVVDEDI